MRFLVLFSLLAVSVSAHLDTYSDFKVFAAKNHHKSVSDYATAIGIPTLDQQWQEFKAKYAREYNGGEEEERKFYFLKNIAFIESHNKYYESGDASHEVGVNEFADWTPEEWERMGGAKETPLNETIKMGVPLLEVDPSYYASIPASFDWRKKGVIGPIKNQGPCGCCWAFACAATIEAAYAIKHKKKVTLSEQQLLDCTASSNSCNGGYVYLAYQYAKNHGLVGSASYSYHAKKSHCSKSSGQFKLHAYSRLSVTTDEAIKSAIMKHGPVSVNIDASGNDFRLYKSGVIKTGGRHINHAVSVVGWGPGYWIIRNQWGTTWGVKGYGKLASGRNLRAFNTELYSPSF